MGLFSKSSSTKQTTTNNAYDNRQVNDAGGGIIGAGNTQDYSTTLLVNDSRSVSDSRTFTDNRSSSSSSSLSYVGVDAAKVNEQNAALMRSLGGFQVNAIERAAELGSDLFSVGSQNAAQAWDRTLDASENLISKLLATTDRTTAQAGTVANAAISSFQPTENKTSETVQRLGIAIAVAIALAVIFKGK